MDKRKLDKEVKEQKASDEKEYLSKEIGKVGGLITDIDELSKVCGRGKNQRLLRSW